MTKTSPRGERTLDPSAQRALRRLAEHALDIFVVAAFPSLRLLSADDEADLPFDAEFVDALRRDIGPAALAGRDWKGDATFHTAAGGALPVRAFVTGLPASGRFPDRLAIGAIDATSGLDNRAALQTGQMLLRALLAHVPDSIYFKDLESRFILASDSLARKKFLDSADAFIGKTDFDIFTEKHAREAYEDEQRIIATGQPILGLEEKETWGDGRVTWVDTCKLPLYDARGQIIGTFGISRDITERKKAEENLRTAQQELLATTRLAGMAEMAAGVLHNVGNALNSVTTSASILSENLAASHVPVLAKVAQMLSDADDVGAFLTCDPRGKQLPGYIVQLAAALTGEREAMKKELEDLRRSVDHMVEVVAMQQEYARGSSLVEDCQPAELVEESLHISAISLARHGIIVVRDFKPAPSLKIERHKVMQILVNLIRNAKDAMDASGQAEKPITISVNTVGEARVHIVVRDTGVGILPENLARIFQFGFTTRANGHGFGLHSSVNAADELGGKLSAHSDGPGKGASFTLELPVTRGQCRGGAQDGA